MRAGESGSVRERTVHCRPGTHLLLRPNRGCALKRHRGQSLALLLVLFPLWACQRGPHQREASWPMMAETLVIHVSAADSATAAKALQAGHDEVDLVDNLMSTAQDNSEISVVNRRAGRDSITYISPSMTTVLAEGLDLGTKSNGALDVTVGPLVQLWGFQAQKQRVPSDAQIDSARRLMGARRIAFNQSERTVRLPERGMRLDLDALAKGFAVDRAARAMRTAGALAGSVRLGQRTVTFGASPDGKWRAVIPHP